MSNELTDSQVTYLVDMIDSGDLTYNQIKFNNPKLLKNERILQALNEHLNGDFSKPDLEISTEESQRLERITNCYK